MSSTHRIHVWYIYLHLVDIYGKIVGKYTSLIQSHGSYGVHYKLTIYNRSAYSGAPPIEPPNASVTTTSRWPYLQWISVSSRPLWFQIWL